MATTKYATTGDEERLVCVHCRTEVHDPVVGRGGVPIHGGHVDGRLDRACGAWGYRRKGRGGFLLAPREGVQ